ncbi:helix-turn-helix transcriptional regulator [Arcticibacterium luteifluviistationis]|uniref:DNA-binding transcriptional regulator n=1 Tax=Arcticibacterium luteifluviistationis TaxID=1784714 RepID=A0A2Z4GCD0_9BACT|nr:YafY family protein [Arcticibacterium luteifluviistationis]AWV98952.1 DNA-binding transcriptional regulator [Arcticibacterium luteifluviistationis]
MEQNDTKRISRLTAILTQLQSKRILTAPELASKFGLSVRTIYRDIRALERAGVPIITEDGKGYSLMDGYKIPPVMFTESEANALILAEQLVLKNKDASLVKEYAEAINKIKAVLRNEVKDKANLLSDRTRNSLNLNTERTSSSLTTLQFALTNYFLVSINYTNESGEVSERLIEPFAILSTENWLLIAYCRKREAFRFFRLDRITHLEMQLEHFSPHKMTLQEYFDKYH